LLAFAASRNASDVLLIAGAPAMLRVNGTWRRLRTASWKRRTCAACCCPCWSRRSWRSAGEESVDLGFVREGLGASAINIHSSTGTLAASIRLLPARIPSLEVAAPAAVARQAGRTRRQGLGW